MNTEYQNLMNTEYQSISRVSVMKAVEETISYQAISYHTKSCYIMDL